MDTSLISRINNQIFKFEAALDNSNGDDSAFTLDYERGRYRQEELVGLIRDTVPYFSLTESELKEFDPSEISKRAFTRISDADRDSKGDYGELLLFIILSIFYDAPKFVTKARLRSTTREQIKGFDCAHFSIDKEHKVTLWLGEAKFHQGFSDAISSAFTSLDAHLNNSAKIKSELKLLGGEIEINKTIAAEKYSLLKSYVDGGRSLDSIPINVPVLITYDSTCVKNFCKNQSVDIFSDEFKDKLIRELEKKFRTIYKKTWPKYKNIKIIFFVMPFSSVSEIKKQIEKVEQAMKI